MKNLLQFTSLIIGPLLGAVSTLFWEGDRYGVTAGVLIVISSALWVYGLIGVWERVAARRPWLGHPGLLLAIVGCTGGIAFGMQGFFEGIFAVSGERSLEAAAEHPLASALVLWLPGPAMPLCIAGLGIALAWTRLAPWWLAALLITAGVAFPLSRISRTAAIAHVADLLILAAFAILATLLLKGRLDRAPTPA